MKTPSLIASVERDLRDGHAAVIQIVSTGEALMERRLAEIRTEEWGDVAGRHSPARICAGLSRLTASDRNSTSRLPIAKGNLVVAARLPRWPARCNAGTPSSVVTCLIERLASLTPVHGALDQIVQRFGIDIVAGGHWALAAGSFRKRGS
jgi:hypothetical protein